MEQEVFEADEERDNKIPSNFTGAQLHHCGMNVKEGHWIMVRYDSVKKANTAANICGNKSRIEGTKNVFTVRRSTDKDDVAWLTIAKVPEYVRLQQKCIDVQGISQSAETVITRELKKAVEGMSNWSAAELEKYEASVRDDMRNGALQAIQEGKTDEFILTVLKVDEETLERAKYAWAESKKPKCVVAFLPGADDDWDKSNWTEEQVRGDSVVYAHIVLRRKRGDDPVNIAAEGRLPKTVVAKLCAELNAEIAAEEKALKKASLARGKKGSVTEPEEAETYTPAVPTQVWPVTADGKKSKMQIEQEQAAASQDNDRTFKDCIVDDELVCAFKNLRKLGNSEHDIALKLSIRDDVAVQVGAFVDTIN